MCNLDSENAIFIIGAKRGGTTLMRRVVDAHSKISIPPPGWLHHFIAPYLYSYGDLASEDNMLALIEDSISIPMIEQYWQVDDRSSEILAKLPEMSFRGLYFTLTSYYVKATGKEIVYWGSKSPADAFWIREIKRDFPRTKFIFLHRDGRDTATDLINTIWAPYNQISASNNWLRHMQAIEAAKLDIPKDCYFEIKYEDFVHNPVVYIKDICIFLELDYEENMLNFHTQKTDPFVTESYHVKTNNPITGEYVGIYKNLPKREQNQQIEIMGSMLKRLGYEHFDVAGKTSCWEKLRNLEEDDHGGMITRGGVELMYDLYEGRQNRLRKGLWRPEEKEAYLTAIS